MGVVRGLTRRKDGGWSGQEQEERVVVDRVSGSAVEVMVARWSAARRESQFGMRVASAPIGLGPAPIPSNLAVPVWQSRRKGLFRGRQ